LRRRDHWMIRRSRVLGGVLVGRRIAAERRAAALARAEMHPRRTDLHALVAKMFPRMFHRGDAVDVRAAPVTHAQRTSRTLRTPRTLRTSRTPRTLLVSFQRQ